ESNRIEGILRDPTDDEIAAHERLLGLLQLSVTTVGDFQAVVAPGRRIRSDRGMNVPGATPASRAAQPSWWRRISSSGAAPPRQSLPRRGNRFFALCYTRTHISQASVAHRDQALGACGSGDVRQHRLPCRSGTAALRQAVLRPGRVTTSAAA